MKNTTLEPAYAQVGTTIPRELFKRANALCDKLGLRKLALWPHALEIGISHIEKNGIRLPATSEPVNP